MNNENVGIEINGGSDNEITRSEITINGSGKGIVTNQSSRNKVDGVSILINAEKTLTELKSVLNMLNDQTKNVHTDNTFKTDSLALIDNILHKGKQGDIRSQITDLTTILSNWITISTALSPILSSYILKLSPYIGN